MTRQRAPARLLSLPGIGGTRRPSTASPGTRRNTDKRYGTARWRKVRLGVLQRDGYRCFAPDCPRLGNVADHIRSVGPFTTDAEFYNPLGLRASCHFHNTRRGHVEAFQRETGELRAHRRRTAVITRDYSRRERLRG